MSNVKRLISNMLPVDKAKVLRYRYRMARQRLHRAMTEDYFRLLLTQRLGIGKGDTLFIHSSVDFLNVDFSPLKLLSILTDLIGEEGTLVFPAWHTNVRAEDYLSDENNLFDVKRSPAVLGLLPELARRLPGARRSIHPINSIVAIGKHVDEIVGGHEQSIYPCDESSPYYKMLKYDAKIVGIGVNANFLSFVHCPEDMMKDAFPVQTRTEQAYTGRVKLLSGEIINVRTLAAHKNIQSRNIPRFMKKYVSKAIFAPYMIRGSEFYVADANALFHRITELAKQNITIYSV